MNTSEAQKIKTELDQLRLELAQAQRRGEYQRASELVYGQIPWTEAQLVRRGPYGTQHIF